MLIEFFPYVTDRKEDQVDSLAREMHESFMEISSDIYSSIIIEAMASILRWSMIQTSTDVTLTILYSLYEANKKYRYVGLAFLRTEAREEVDKRNRDKSRPGLFRK